MKIFIGADHRGFGLKELLRKRLAAVGHEVVDCGAARLEPGDDYPPYALKVAQGVAAAPGSRGVLLCGSGLGVGVVANKVRGVRAGLGYSADAVAHGRAHDDLNVLALAADALAPEDVEALVELFLMTPFDGAERNARRRQEIASIEAQNFK